MVGKDVNLAILIYYQEFLPDYLRKIRSQAPTGYFPFVSRIEIDIQCVSAGSKGCNICKDSGLARDNGRRMVHPMF